MMVVAEVGDVPKLRLLADVTVGLATPHPAVAATDRLASNKHYSYCQFNTQYMLFPGE